MSTKRQIDLLRAVSFKGVSCVESLHNNEPAMLLFATQRLTNVVLSSAGRITRVTLVDSEATESPRLLTLQLYMYRHGQHTIPPGVKAGVELRSLDTEAWLL